MERDTVTGRQGFFLLFLFLLGNLVTAAGAKGIQSGWTVLLLSAGLALPVLTLFLRASGGRPAGRVFPETLGPRLGTAVTAVYCGIAVLMAGDSMRLFADFIVINDLNDAGAWGNTALLALVVLLLLFCDLRGLGKAAWAIQPPVTAMLFASLLLTASKMDPAGLLPLFDLDAETYCRGIVGTLGGTLMPTLFPVLLLNGAAPAGWKKQARWAGAGALLLLALLTLRDGAVLGYPLAGMFRFPGFVAAGRLRHSEILISAAFVLSQPFRTALLLRYVQACLTTWRPAWRRGCPPVLLLLAAVSGALSWSSEQVHWRTGGEAVISLLLLAGPVAAVLAERRRKRRDA